MTRLTETRGPVAPFGALAAARDIDFLEAGARHADRSNGAGKPRSSILTGLIPPTSGQVLLKGRDITGAAQAARVKLGIARTFQINRLFRGLSVLDNVYLAVAERVGAAPAMFRPAGLRRDVVEESMHLLETLNCGDASTASTPTAASALSYRTGLETEVCRTRPAAGVPAPSHIILDAIDAAQAYGVLIIDHDMGLVFRFASDHRAGERSGVRQRGPREIGHPGVRAVYLGQAPHG
jgi:ABC-type branched-subunit amino acid transport system ATPase component